MFKKTIFIALACVGLSALVSSCGGAGVKSVVDPKVLENKEEVQKIHATILKSMGEQASKADEITIFVNNPADKGKKGDTYLNLIVDMQDPKKPKQLLRQQFSGELGRWLDMREGTVQASGDAENFRLEDELFDFTKIDAEKLYNLIQSAYNKDNNDAGKYTYRYVDFVRINITGIDITIKGKLESNDQIISKSAKFDLDGNLIE